MKEIIKMLVVLTLICGVCGLLLATVESKTKKRIEEQILMNVQGPAVKRVLEGSTNEADLITGRKEIEVSGKKLTVFIGKKDGKPWALAYESSASGFGGDIGVMVGFHLEKDALTGIGITTHKETPGLGARVTEKEFSANFKDKLLTDNINIRKDNGVIDAITGATISSRGVCTAVREAIKLSGEVKEKIEQDMGK